MTISQIAAGEVIERPASVVKELMDNSLDAGADRIVIRCEAGGKKRIEISDNGRGISVDDLPMAPVRHATSKIQTLDDIYLAHSMGFRGEALASICHVASVRIRSKVTGQGAFEISANSRGIGEVKPCAAPDGTSIVVTDLFSEIPVRFQYLKSDAAELSHISEGVRQYSLVYPNVQFVLVHDEKEVINTSGINQLSELIAYHFGTELSDHLIPVSFEDSVLTLDGIISAPTLTFSTRNRQLVSVNQRVVKNSLIQRVVTEAFQDMIPHRRHPLALLNLTMDPAAIDVNIHPQKIDIKFLHSGQVFDALRTAFRRTLKQNSAIVGLGLVPNDSQAENGSSTDIQPFLVPAIDRIQPVIPGAVFDQPERYSYSELAPVPSVSGSANSAPLPPYFQVFDTYIGVPAEDGLWLLDQHAVHERILYEKIKQTHAQNVMLQELLIPDIIEFSESELSDFVAYRNIFSPFHLFFEEFGPRQFLIRQLPINFVGVRMKDFILECLNRASDLGPNIELDRPDQKDKLQMMACKAAIKAGKKLTQGEIRSLVADFLDSPSTFTCPHGRPLAIRLGKKELEKLFHRI